MKNQRVTSGFPTGFSGKKSLISPPLELLSIAAEIKRLGNMPLANWVCTVSLRSGGTV